MGSSSSSDGEAAASSAHKGLSNATGHNNCFLNVGIQALWHVNAFRERFLSLQHTHRHTFSSLPSTTSTGSATAAAAPCLMCALLDIFSEIRFSENRIIPSENLRLALATLHSSTNRFQLYEMDDADEGAVISYVI